MAAKLKIVGLWTLSALMAFVMVASGIQKFTSPAWERMFRVWGYPDHFYAVIGVIEAAAGLCLLVPRIAAPAALLLMCVMAGAAITRMLNGGNGVGELVFLALLGVIAYARRPWRARSAVPVAEAATVR